MLGKHGAIHTLLSKDPTRAMSKAWDQELTRRKWSWSHERSSPGSHSLPVHAAKSSISRLSCGRDTGKRKLLWSPRSATAKHHKLGDLNNWWFAVSQFRGDLSWRSSIWRLGSFRGPEGDTDLALIPSRKCWLSSLTSLPASYSESLSPWHGLVSLSFLSWIYPDLI